MLGNLWSAKMASAELQQFISIFFDFFSGAKSRVLDTKRVSGFREVIYLKRLPISRVNVS